MFHERWHKHRSLTLNILCRRQKNKRVYLFWQKKSLKKPFYTTKCDNSNTVCCNFAVRRVSAFLKMVSISFQIKTQHRHLPCFSPWQCGCNKWLRPEHNGMYGAEGIRAWFNYRRALALGRIHCKKFPPRTSPPVYSLFTIVYFSQTKRKIGQ